MKWFSKIIREVRWSASFLVPFLFFPLCKRMLAELKFYMQKFSESLTPLINNITKSCKEMLDNLTHQDKTEKLSQFILRKIQTFSLQPGTSSFWNYNTHYCTTCIAAVVCCCFWKILLPLSVSFFAMLLIS